MRLTFCILLLCFIGQVQAQTTLILADKDSGESISDALAFIDKTNFNVVSDSTGKIVIEASVSGKEVLNITHLNYKIKEVPVRSISSGDTLWLTLADHQLSNIEVFAKSSRKRKKRLNSFVDKFLGVHRKRYKAEILNPEVLLFREEGTDLIASANLPLIIRNEKLGYLTKYWLNNYRASKDGLINYNGKYFITDIAGELGKKEDILELRNKVYSNSRANLLKSMIDATYKENFEINHARLLQDGSIELLRKLNLRQNFKAIKGQDKYVLSFNGILNIEHLNVRAKQVRHNMSGAAGLGNRAEADMIGHDRSTNIGVSKYENSYLFSKSGKIIFDGSGKILNSADIKEYGYWGTLGLADVLPVMMEVENTDINPHLKKDPLQIFIDLLYPEDNEIKASITYLKNHWENSFVPPLIDLLLLSGQNAVKKEIANLLSDKTAQHFGQNYYNWLRWLWQQPNYTSELYADFKAELYGIIDEKFDQYFRGRFSQSSIRMDEVVWGGVKQDGIPPLRNPLMIFPDQAGYLSDSDIVFGFTLHGDTRAYPKRILAWHEFFTDKIGGVNIAGVYCTLCGTVIAYNMDHQGIFHNLGTSGFLYRSNKLMYDAATQSLWNTIEGRPVLGPLTGENIELQTFPIVTTTWGQWKEEHPETTVLSIETGHRRNYDEGAAYREYFASDLLMFPVPLKDSRLRNKDEVLVLRVEGYKSDPIAISVNYLQKNPLTTVAVDKKPYVIITEFNGPSRVYESRHIKFDSYINGVLKESTGSVWEVTEDGLVNNKGIILKRIPSHRIFWFAWFNAYPETRLIK